MDLTPFLPGDHYGGVLIPPILQASSSSSVLETQQSTGPTGNASSSQRPSITQRPSIKESTTTPPLSVIESISYFPSISTCEIISSSRPISSGDPPQNPLNDEKNQIAAGESTTLEDETSAGAENEDCRKTQNKVSSSSGEIEERDENNASLNDEKNQITAGESTTLEDDTSAAGAENENYQQKQNKVTSSSEEIEERDENKAYPVETGEQHEDSSIQKENEEQKPQIIDSIRTKLSKKAQRILHEYIAIVRSEMEGLAGSREMIQAKSEDPNCPPQPSARELVENSIDKHLRKLMKQNISPLTWGEFQELRGSDSKISSLDAQKKAISSRIEKLTNIWDRMVRDIEKIIKASCRDVIGLYPALNFTRYPNLMNRIYSLTDEYIELLSKDAKKIITIIKRYSGYLDPVSARLPTAGGRMQDETDVSLIQRDAKFDAKFTPGSLQSVVAKVQLNRKLKLSSDEWKLAAHCQNVPKCRVTFVFGFRRHHCRVTGFSFCNSHAPIRKDASEFCKTSEPVRICDMAYWRLKTLKKTRDMTNSGSVLKREKREKSGKDVRSKEGQKSPKRSKESFKDLVHIDDSSYFIHNTLIAKHLEKVRASLTMMASQVVMDTMLDRISGSNKEGHSLWDHVTSEGHNPINFDDENQISSLLQMGPEPMTEKKCDEKKDPSVQSETFDFDVGDVDLKEKGFHSRLATNVLEMQFVLRKPIQLEEDLHAVHLELQSAFKHLHLIEEAAKKLGVTTGTAFAALIKVAKATRGGQLQRTPVKMDGLHKSQKFLMEVNLDELGSIYKDELAHGVQGMMDLIRIKIEDSNDLNTTKNAVTDCLRIIATLKLVSKAEGISLWKAYKKYLEYVP